MAVLAKILLQESPRVAEARPGVPKALDALVTRMLAKDPAARPQSLQEVSAELDVVSSRFGPRALPTLGSVAGSTLHSVDADPASGEQGALTRAEHRLATVVLAGDPTARTDAAALGHEAASALSAAVEPFGGHLTPLAGGSLIVTTWTPGTAVDRAERAALCALALQERFRELPIAVVTGRGRVAAKVVEGDVIDRGVRVAREDEPGRHRPRRDHRGHARRRASRSSARASELPALGRPGRRRTRARCCSAGSTRASAASRELAMLEGVWAGCVAEPVASAVLVTGARGHRQVAPVPRAPRPAAAAAASRSRRARRARPIRCGRGSPVRGHRRC